MRGALDEVRPYLESHGGDVELLALEDGVVRLRLRGQLQRLPVLDGDAEARRSRRRSARRRPTSRGIEAEGVPAPQLLQIEPLRECPAGQA